MANFGQMKTFVSKRLQDSNNTAVSLSDVGDLINQALDYWKNTRFYFNEITDTATLTRQNTAIPLPSDWLCPSIDNCFVIEYSGIRYPLVKLSEMEYNAGYLANGIGQPMWFSRQADTEYKCYPIPDRDYTVRRFYLRDYEPFVNDSDTNAFSEKAAGLLEYTAAAWGSRDFRQDMAMHDAFWAQVDREKKDALQTTKKDNAKGYVSTYSNFFY